MVGRGEGGAPHPRNVGRAGIHVLGVPGVVEGNMNTRLWGFSLRFCFSNLLIYKIPLSLSLAPFFSSSWPSSGWEN